MSDKELEAAYTEIINKYSQGEFKGRKYSRKNMYSDMQTVFREDGSAVKRYETCTLCMKEPERNQRFMKCSGCVDENGDGTPYCSKECQRLHWPDHKLRCKSTQERRKTLQQLKEVDKMKEMFQKALGLEDSALSEFAPSIASRGPEIQRWTEMFAWTWIRAAHRALSHNYGSKEFNYEDTALLIRCKSRPKSETAGNPALFANVESAEFVSFSSLPRPKWDGIFNSMKVMASKRKRAEQISRASLGNSHRGVVWMIFLFDNAVPLLDVHSVSTSPSQIFEKKLDHSDWIEELQKFAHNGWIVRRTSDRNDANSAVGTLSKRGTTWHWTKLSASDCQKHQLAKEYRSVFQGDYLKRR
ncbi:MAG: hypothetical protein NXY57DRAFT_673977 [Lentinula lateritia]|uniref:MYND-type domain-containing protein n=1 Tax=Lentinula lateritia TaxID=40482 RepID=A0ABQ8V0T6_9AGAR|nr:MAG: hypothetical protein NXY57DRAFT_673977 [Lentinula lateritia]KAJ4467086.1 hypothetical protein C8R41DRAFT_925867 [Lentinula lateritia]